MVRPRYGPSLVFRLSLVCSKFKFSAGIQIFGMKITSHGKPGSKNSFPRSDSRCGNFRVRFMVKLGYRDTLYCNICPFSVGSQLFAMKITSHGKPGPQNSFRRSDLRCSDFRVRFWVKLGYRDNLYSNISQFTVGNQLFVMKITSYGKPGPKNSFPRSDLMCGDFRVRFRVKLGYRGQVCHMK